MTLDCAICEKPTDATLCWSCAGHAVTWVNALPGLIGDMHAVITRQTRVYKGARPRTIVDEDWRATGGDALRPTPSPANLDAAELRDRTITLWQAYRWITPHHGAALRTHPRAADMWRHIRAGHRKALNCVDRAPVAFFAGPCGAETTIVDREVRDGTEYVTARVGPCDRDLYAFPGADEITCNGYRSDGRGCGARHSFADRTQQLVDSIEDALLPLELLRAVTRRPDGRRPLLDLRWPNPATVRSWRFRGQLVERSVDRQGRELFRGGDVLDLVRSWNGSTASRRAAAS